MSPAAASYTLAAIALGASQAALWQHEPLAYVAALLFALVFGARGIEKERGL